MPASNSHESPLRRIIGAPTALFIGMGVAIGSGIFRTPGIVAGQLQEPWLIVFAWLFGGLFVLMAGMVTAELATRFPQAGGEYVFLREAYGEFVAFFFGWAYTIFIIGAGAASIAAAVGDFGCSLGGLSSRWSGPIAALAVAGVTIINAIGLRTGATTQNVLTISKIVALMTVVVVGLTCGADGGVVDLAVGEDVDSMDAVTAIDDTSNNIVSTSPVSQDWWKWISAFVAGVIPVLWAYGGTTDSVKMAEEIKDVHRALPRALIGCAVAITCLYVLVNVSLMRLVPPTEMTGVESVPGEAMRRVFGRPGQRAMLIVAILVCLGSLSSTILATIRVTFALARDGLSFGFMGRMSASQSPVGALIVVGVFATVLVLYRKFEQVLSIYFFASSILFGLSYASLMVFRIREKQVAANVFRCPAGMLQAGVLILIQIALAVRIVIEWVNAGRMRDAYGTVGLMLVLALLYVVWKRFSRPHNNSLG